MRDELVLGEQAGLLWAWWRGDEMVTGGGMEGVGGMERLEIGEVRDVGVLMEGTEKWEIERLLGLGHRAYVAWMDGEAVAIGWSAVGEAAFGGGRVKFWVPEGERYLYYFVTRPEWRGRGIYPRMLRYIVGCEEAERFWIIHQLENRASYRGIEKAGFRVAAKVYFLVGGGLGLVAGVEGDERAVEGARLLGLPLVGGGRG